MGTDDDHDGVEKLINTYDSGKIIRLHFVGDTANQALITQIARSFRIDINILQGKITQMQQGAYGTLFVQMDGETDEIARAINYITDETSVEVEVVQDVE